MTLRLGVARPQRIFALHGRDRVNRMRPADRLRARLGEPKRAHFARLDEIGHRANRILDRHGWIDAVLIEEIDYIDAEPFERSLGDPI